MGLKTLDLPASFVYKIASIDTYHEGSKWMSTFTLEQQDPVSLSLALQTPVFIETEECTAGGVAVDPYGALTVASSVSNDVTVTLAAELNGALYQTASPVALGTAAVGDTITLAAVS